MDRSRSLPTRLPRVWLALVSALALGCASELTPVETIGVDDGASQGDQVQRRVDGTRSVRLTLETDATLQLGAGAVVEPVTVHFERVADVEAKVLLKPLWNGVMLASAPYSLTPAETPLNGSATLWLPVSNATGPVNVLWLSSEQDRSWEVVASVDVVDGMAAFAIESFGVYVLVSDAGAAGDDGGEAPRPRDAGVVTPRDAGSVVTPNDAGSGVPPGLDVDAACVLLSRCDAGVEVPDTGSEQGSSGPDSIRGTLVNILAQDASGFIAQRHKMELFNAETGRLLGITTSSKPGTGQFQFDGVPAGIPIGIHVVGNGPADNPTSTYDAIQYYAPKSGETLLRISTIGTASVWSTTGVFTPRQDRAQLAGAVYRVDATGKRVAAIGCAQVFLDDQAHPAQAVDQRYVAASGLPTTLDKQSKTLRASGKFYFGNLAPGLHSLRVSVDGGQTFLALVDGDTKRSFFVPWTRAEASGNYKEIYTFLGIDVPGNDPTPANCPAD